MTTNLLNFKRDFLSKIPVIAPDPTFYKQIKKISLELLPVKEIPECDIPLPLSFRYLDDFFVNLWKRHHGARLFTICKNSKRSTTSPPYRSIFPGPYIPFLDGKMKVIGDSAFSVFLNTIITVKQRIPDINKLHQNENGYIYENTYYPIIKKINEPEEGWNIKFFECPVIDGVYFPIAGSLKYTKKDLNQLDRIIKLIANECQSLYQKYFQNDKFTKKDIRKIISLIRCVQYLYTPHIRDSEVEIFKEILTLFKHRNRLEKPAELLFEIDHVVSYFHKLRNKEILLSGAYGMAWLDVIRLPVESLVETELCDIERVLREISDFQVKNNKVYESKKEILWDRFVTFFLQQKGNLVLFSHKDEAFGFGIEKLSKALFNNSNIIEAVEFNLKEIEKAKNKGEFQNLWTHGYKKNGNITFETLLQIAQKHVDEHHEK